MDMKFILTKSDFLEISLILEPTRENREQINHDFLVFQNPHASPNRNAMKDHRG